LIVPLKVTGWLAALLLCDVLYVYWSTDTAWSGFVALRVFKVAEERNFSRKDIAI
jgi:hypothetical protein